MPLSTFENAKINSDYSKEDKSSNFKINRLEKFSQISSEPISSSEKETTIFEIKCKSFRSVFSSLKIF